MKFSHIISTVLAFLSLASCTFAEKPIAILGGQVGVPYAALLYADGRLVTIAGLPPTGITFRVAMNASATGLIGGTNGVDAYAAFVTPNGILKPVDGLLAPGEIYSVAINKSGLGIVGGGHATTNIPFAAIVKENNPTINLLGLPASGLIYGVAIDKFGTGIIGGIGDGNSAYAALASRTGNLTPIQGLPTTGAIYWVSTNDSETRFIGGQDNTSVYAAFVTPNGTVKPIANLPAGQNYSVAINRNNSAIMGGTSLTLPYAALVDPKGRVKTLKGLPKTAGIIYNTALNSSGTGLIAGFSTKGPFGAFVDPDGKLTKLKDLPDGEGFLDGAALHEAGIALVGGVSQGVPFAALAAPNGKLTYLSGLPAFGEINTIALSVLDRLVPKGVGTFESTANTQFTFAKVLSQHCAIHNRNVCCEPSTRGCSTWYAPFGNYSYNRAQHGSHGYTNQIGGIVLGVDCDACCDVVVGGGFAYAQNRVNHKKHVGHATIHQESALLYTTWTRPNIYVNAALWGGPYQTCNKRHSFPRITSKSHQNGWNVSPHFEFGLPRFYKCNNVIDPFVALDWLHTFQSRYREHGSSGFNIRLKSQYAAIIRTEAGCRFYSYLNYKWGHFVAEEKLSYVNRTPSHKGRGRASFVDSSSTFGVVTFNREEQNLACVQVHFEFVPTCWHNCFASIDYQGEFGSRFESHLLTFGFGRDY